MKVWELIAELSRAKAGADIVLGLSDTMFTAEVSVQQIDEDQVSIVGGDVRVCDADGNEGELLSELIENSTAAPH